MKFYDRENEILKLHDIRALANQSARLTIVTGRRRIGKTSLLMKAYGDEPMLYFFVSRESEAGLCREFADEVKAKLHVPVLGNVEHFSELFEFIMALSKSRPLTLVIDEFQNFMGVKPYKISTIVDLWVGDNHV